MFQNTNKVFSVAPNLQENKPIEVLNPRYWKRIIPKKKNSFDFNLVHIPLKENCKKSAVKKSLPNVMLLNARSLINKANEPAILIDKHNCDITSVTETWLTNNVPSEVVNCFGLTLLRSDRPCSKGGEVVVYINDIIPVKIRYDLCDQCFECLWITLGPKWLPRSISKITAACVYFPPNLLSNDLESSDTAFIVAGDFNPSSSGFQQKHSARHCDFRQVVKQPTRSTNTLDLIFTNIVDCYEDPEMLAPLSTSDHNVIKWKSKSHVARNGNTVNIKVRPLRPTQLDRFGNSQRNYVWSPVLSTIGIDEKADVFLRITKGMFEEFSSRKNNKSARQR